MPATPGSTKTELRLEPPLLVRAYVSLTIFGALWGGGTASRFVVNNVSGGGTFGLLLFIAIITAVPIAIALSVRKGSSLGWWISVILITLSFIVQVGAVWSQPFATRTLFALVCPLIFLGLLVHPSTLSWMGQNKAEPSLSFLQRHRGLVWLTALAVGLALLTVTCAFLASTPPGSVGP